MNEELYQHWIALKDIKSLSQRLGAFAQYRKIYEDLAFNDQLFHWLLIRPIIEENCINFNINYHSNLSFLLRKSIGYYSYGTNGRLAERVIVIPFISENSEKLTSLERSRGFPNGATESTAPDSVKNKVLEICFMRTLNL